MTEKNINEIKDIKQLFKEARSSEEPLCIKDGEDEVYLLNHDLLNNLGMRYHVYGALIDSLYGQIKGEKTYTTEEVMQILEEEEEKLLNETA